MFAIKGLFMKKLNILLFVLLLITFSIMILVFHYSAKTKKQVVTYPFFASIKYNKANVRTGPGLDFPVIWVYKKRETPIKVIVAYKKWYQIEDYSGKIGWLSQDNVTSKHSAFVKTTTNVYRTADSKGKVISKLDKNIMVLVLASKGMYSKVYLNLKNITIKGWVLSSHLWGYNFIK